MLASAAGASVAADLAATADARAAIVSIPITTRLCPDCDAEMGAARVLGIDVDACAHHGTWFDRTELATLIARVLPDVGEADVVVPEGMVSHAERWRQMPFVLLSGFGG